MISRTSALQKQQRRKAMFYKSLSLMLSELAIDEPVLRDIHITRLEVSADKSTLRIFFSGINGEASFKEALGTLLLYKGSLRKAIGTKIQVRYVPQLEFVYDTTVEKSQRITELLNQIIQERND